MSKRGLCVKYQSIGVVIFLLFRAGMNPMLFQIYDNLWKKARVSCYFFGFTEKPGGKLRYKWLLIKWINRRSVWGLPGLYLISRQIINRKNTQP
jgi:hypothetical protein